MSYKISLKKQGEKMRNIANVSINYKIQNENTGSDMVAVTNDFWSSYLLHFTVLH